MAAAGCAPLHDFLAIVIEASGAHGQALALFGNPESCGYLPCDRARFRQPMQDLGKRVCMRPALQHLLDDVLGRMHLFAVCTPCAPRRMGLLENRSRFETRTLLTHTHAHTHAHTPKTFRKPTHFVDPLANAVASFTKCRCLVKAVFVCDWMEPHMAARYTGSSWLCGMHCRAQVIPC